MKQYVEQCPFLGNNRGIVSSVLSTSATASDNTSLQDKCPFLKKVKSPAAIIKKVAPQTKEDIIEDTRKYILTTNIFTKEVWRWPFPEIFFFEFTDVGFKYDEFFKSQILKKKMDHSYRVFKKVNRNAQQFPNALEYTWGQRPIQVWCSNDYLGMSAHPQVKDSVM